MQVSVKAFCTYIRARFPNVQVSVSERDRANGVLEGRSKQKKSKFLKFAIECTRGIEN